MPTLALSYPTLHQIAVLQIVIDALVEKKPRSSYADIQGALRFAVDELVSKGDEGVFGAEGDAEDVVKLAVGRAATFINEQAITAGADAELDSEAPATMKALFDLLAMLGRIGGVHGLVTLSLDDEFGSMGKSFMVNLLKMGFRDMGLFISVYDFLMVPGSICDSHVRQRLIGLHNYDIASRASPASGIVTFWQKLARPTLGGTFTLRATVGSEADFVVVGFKLDGSGAIGLSGVGKWTLSKLQAYGSILVLRWESQRSDWRFEGDQLFVGNQLKCRMQPLVTTSKGAVPGHELATRSARAGKHLLAHLWGGGAERSSGLQFLQALLSRGGITLGEALAHSTFRILPIKRVVVDRGSVHVVTKIRKNYLIIDRPDPQKAATYTLAGLAESSNEYAVLCLRGLDVTCLHAVAVKELAEGTGAIISISIGVQNRLMLTAAPMDWVVEALFSFAGEKVRIV